LEVDGSGDWRIPTTTARTLKSLHFSWHCQLEVNGSGDWRIPTTTARTMKRRDRAHVLDQADLLQDTKIAQGLPGNDSLGVDIKLGKTDEQNYFHS
jgi:hypothetical protein